MFLLATLVQSAHAASGGDDISPTTLGVVMLGVGVVIVLFSDARAEQQAGMIGMDPGFAKILYKGMGAVIALLGLLTALGIFVPATVG
ncbi:MAG: hypothetical protein KC656_08920 [Myxococcales bacterium]|nr:hypothetical protein [Myxococcales bacterium]MCB9669472.1 hypothetical protein [Alphaproteobacteria bacterium]MCB9692144.1 hypothetical protein [Alphaproteobacteria bacterium]